MACTSWASRNFNRLPLTDGSIGIVNELKIVYLVFLTDNSRNAEYDKLKQITTFYLTETESWSIVVFLCGDTCSCVMKQQHFN
jgi:hypothetical protein